MQDKCSLVKTLQACNANFSCRNFSVSGFGVPKVYVLAKVPSREKRGRKLPYLRNWYVIMVYFLCISTKKSTGFYCYVWENYKFQHFQYEIFLMFTHFENVPMENKTFVATTNPRKSFWSKVHNELCCKYCMPLKHEVFHILFLFQLQTFSCSHGIEGFMRVVRIKTVVW